MYITIIVFKGLIDTPLKSYKNYADVFNKKKARLLLDYSLYKLVIKLIKGK